MLETCTPKFRTWTLLLGRTDITDVQAWTLLWRDGKLEQSAQVQPRGSERYWTSNQSSERLAEDVASYLARPDVPPGAVSRIRGTLDSTALTRLDLLRAVTRSGGSDLVCHEIAAEPPNGSTRGPHLGSRELALVERYRTTVSEAADQRSLELDSHLTSILHEHDLIERVNSARSLSAFGIEALAACMFGHGSVAPAPECADAASAAWLEEATTDVMQSDENYRLGPIVSALRPILRMHRDPAELSARRWWPRRLRDFGEAGTVPHTLALPSEEGEFVIRQLGDNVTRYQSLAALLETRPDESLRALCRAA